MDGLQVHGRLLADPAVKVECDDGGVTLRIDDVVDSEFWCQVEMRAWCLIEMLERVAAQRGRTRLELMKQLTALRATFAE